MKRKCSYILILGLLLVGCRNQTPVSILEKTTEVSVKGAVVHALIAETPDQQAKGLGGTAVLDWDQGMLFPFPDKSRRIFWMKDMLIPIDIIWLSDTTVVGIEKNIPEPAKGENDSALPKYPSPDTVNYVLETKAGFADKFGLMVGNTVEFK
jgi:uncharacterized protein